MFADQNWSISAVVCLTSDDSFVGRAENAGPENAGLQNDGLNHSKTKKLQNVSSDVIKQKQQTCINQKCFHVSTYHFSIFFIICPRNSAVRSAVPENPTTEPNTNYEVDRMTRCRVMALFEIFQNVRSVAGLVVGRQYPYFLH